MRPIKKFSTGMKIFVMALVLLASFCLLYLSPKLKAMIRVKEDLKSIESELQRMKDVARNAGPPREGEKRKWEVARARVTAIPAEIRFPSLMGALLKLAQATHLADPGFSNIRKASPFKYSDPKVHAGDFLIRMSFYCEYRDLGYFLKGLDEMDLGVVVESLEARKIPPRIYAELQLRPVWRER